MGDPLTHDYRKLSFWLDDLERGGGVLTPRPPLSGPIDVDVAIVGAGYTGLWTAYYLQRLDPALRIAVLEKEIAGFGASGRNGGWCSALFPAPSARIARYSSRQGAAAMLAAMRATVDEVGKVAAAEGIDCDYTKGGTLSLARTPVQWRRAVDEVAEAHSWGATDDDVRLLDARETAGRVRAAGALGAVFTPHCAAIQPAKLVRGLAEVVERRGVRLYERTPVTLIEAHRAHTPDGAVTAGVVVRATEGFTPQLPGLRRVLAPVYSLMLATEPLSAVQWEEIGLRGRETFTELRHLIVYGQRTCDGRLAFGGRGAPYHFGSRVSPSFDHEAQVFDALRRTLVELFPGLEGVRITHTWGGPLGVPRDLHASVGLHRETGRAWAGGYVGDGVATSNLAGRTLADLITGRRSELLDLPWVQHRSRRWEPEPLRWLGVNAALATMTAADAAEARTGRPARSAALLDRFIGG